MKRMMAFIMPMLIEPNGKVKRFLEVARDPEVKKEYLELLKELEVKPEKVGKKLRETTWKGKSLDEIVEELEIRKGR